MRRCHGGPSCRELVRQLVTLLAQLLQLLAPFRQRDARAFLRSLRFADGSLDRADVFSRRTSFSVCGFSGTVGFDPAGVKQPRFDRTDLLGQLAIALRRPRLPPQLRCALLLIAEDFA